MLKFIFGGLLGFLACTWALDAHPGHAAQSLWSRLETMATSTPANASVEDSTSDNRNF